MKWSEGVQVGSSGRGRLFAKTSRFMFFKAGRELPPPPLQSGLQDEAARSSWSWQHSFRKPAITVLSPAPNSIVTLRPLQDGGSNSRTLEEETFEDGVRVEMQLEISGDYQMQLNDVIILCVDNREVITHMPVIDFMKGDYFLMANDPGSHSFSARLQNEKGIVLAQTTVTFEVVPFQTAPAIPRQEPWEWEDDVSRERHRMWSSGFDAVSIVVIIDTSTIDGYKLNIFNQMQQLDPRRFKIKLMDMSCRNGNPISERPFLQLLMDHGLQDSLVEVCLEYSVELVRDTTMGIADIVQRFFATSQVLY